MALFVLVPRALLALGNWLAERRLAQRFPLSLDDSYSQGIARAARRSGRDPHPAPQLSAGRAGRARAERAARTRVRPEDRARHCAGSAVRRRRRARSGIGSRHAGGVGCRAVFADGDAGARKSRCVHRCPGGASAAGDAAGGAGRRIGVPAALRRSRRRRCRPAHGAPRGLAAHAGGDGARSGVASRARAAGFGDAERALRAAIARAPAPAPAAQD